MKMKDAGGVALIGFSLILAAGGFYASTLLPGGKLDAETLCPIDGAVSGTAIIVDKTDAFTEREKVRIKEAISAEGEALKPGARIVVTLLRQGPRQADAIAETVLDLCNPGADANPLYQNPKHVAAKYAEAFAAPVDAVVDDAISEGSARSSPIAEAVTTALKADASPSSEWKVVLISDLMEHSGIGSAYRGSLTAGALKKAMGSVASARLRRARVRIVLLTDKSRSTRQTSAIAMWKEAFLSLTANEPVIEADER